MRRTSRRVTNKSALKRSYLYVLRSSTIACVHSNIRVCLRKHTHTGRDLSAERDPPIRMQMPTGISLPFIISELYLYRALLRTLDKFFSASNCLSILLTSKYKQIEMKSFGQTGLTTDRSVHRRSYHQSALTRMRDMTSSLIGINRASIRVSPQR